MQRSHLVEFIAAALAVSCSTFAQPSRRSYRIAILDDADESARKADWAAFRNRLGELGISEGQNAAFDYGTPAGSTKACLGWPENWWVRSRTLSSPPEHRLSAPQSRRPPRSRFHRRRGSHWKWPCREPFAAWRQCDRPVRAVERDDAEVTRAAARARTLGPARRVLRTGP